MIFNFNSECPRGCHMQIHDILQVWNRKVKFKTENNQVNYFYKLLHLYSVPLAIFGLTLS